MGSPQTHRVVTWRLARATGRRVLAIAYRKAPDHAFPAWIDDGVAAFRWLLARGHAPGDVLFAGDSARGEPRALVRRSGCAARASACRAG